MRCMITAPLPSGLFPVRLPAALQPASPVSGRDRPNPVRGVLLAGWYSRT